MKKKKTLNKILKVALTAFIPIFLISGTIAIIFLAKGYKLDINDGEIEKTGVITLHTTPRRTRIYLDDKSKGKSPKSITGIEPGIHKISLKKDGYLDWNSRVEVVAEHSTIIDAVLFKQDPDITILQKNEVDSPNEVENNEDISENTDQTAENDSAQNTIDNIFFDDNRQIAVFTKFVATRDNSEEQINSTETPNQEQPSNNSKKLEVWSYPLNIKFWQFQVEPEKIATFENISPNQNYNIDISPNSQNLQMIIGPEDNRTRYILDTYQENNNLTPIEDIKSTGEVEPTWSNDSQHIIYSKNNELRSYNIQTKVNTIVYEKDSSDKFLWTSDTNGIIYTISTTEATSETKPDDSESQDIESQNKELFKITRMKSNGSDKTGVLELPKIIETNTQNPIEIKEINQIIVSPQNKEFVLLNNESILIYSVEEEKLKQINASKPQFLGFSDNNMKFAYLDNSNKLYVYTLEVPDGDPVHKIGKKKIYEIGVNENFSNFHWHPVKDYIFFTSEKGEETKAVAIDWDSTQKFIIYQKLAGQKFSIGNSGQYFVGLCENREICKVTITD